MLHDTCTSGTSLVLTVALVRWLKIEVLIPAPADCEVWCDKVSECTEHSADRNSSSAVPGLWSHTARQSAHLLQEFGWEVFNHHPPFSPEISNFTYTSRNSCMVSVSVFRMTEKRWVSRWFQSQAADSYNTGYKIWSHGMTDVSIPKANNSILAVSAPINISIILGLVSVNGPRETNFVDALLWFSLDFDLFKSDAIGKYK